VVVLKPAYGMAEDHEEEHREARQLVELNL